MREIEINGTRLKVLDRGQGAPIVFVHGAVADYRVWELQVKAFTLSHRAVAYSLRHHFPARGHAEVNDYDTAIHADDLAALMQTLGGDRVHLVGHSFGGRVAALAALQHPQLVRSLVLAEPSIFSFLPAHAASNSAMAAHRLMADNLLKLVSTQGGPEAAAAFIDAMAAPRAFAGFPQRLREIVLANAHTLRPLLLARLAEPQNLFEKLPQLRVPTLLVEGELSSRLFKLAVAGLKSALPHAEHVLMPGIAHGLHVEAPRFFNDLLRRFLEGK